MEQVQTQAPQVKTLLDSSNYFYQDLLGYIPEQTSLEQIPESQWNKFTVQRRLNPNSSGVYLPRNQTAIIQGENLLSLFHEYFGHGLYCEQNLTGRKLVALERKLLEEEKQEFSNSKFTLEDVQRFRKQNKTFQELENFRQKNSGRYELFAIWSEYLLSEEHNLKEDFERKYDSLAREEREAIDSVISFSEQYGNLAAMYAFDLKRVQDRKRLRKLSQDIFRERLDRTKLIMHFGSGKEFSDVDFFVVSNDIKSFYSDWIDVRAYNFEEIEDKIKLLEPKITDPVMVGKFVFGDEGYKTFLKNKILNQGITEDSINYNLDKWKYHKKRFLDDSLGKYLQRKNLRSAKTYLTNVLALKNGHKILTFEGLVQYSHTLSQSEKFIELEGGIE